MQKITHIIKQIASTNSNPEKMQILKKHAANEEFVELLRFIYNPYIKTGIAAKKLKKYDHIKSDVQISIKEVVDYFEKHQTGADESIIFAQRFIKGQPDEASKGLASAMVTKSLKIGVTAKTLNKVFGEAFIPKIGCMLGMEYASNKHKVDPPFIVTEKLDGTRRLLIKEKGGIKFYSRSGIQDTGLLELEKEAALLPNNMVYDGELLAIGDFEDSIALRQATSSIANRKNSVKTGLTFNVFDAVPLDEFQAGVSKFRALDRKIFLGAIFSDDSIRHLHKDWAQMIAAFRIHHDFELIRPVPILGMARSEADIQNIVTPLFVEKREGVMLNTVNGFYELKRSKHLLKVKDTQEKELKVVGFLEGIGKYEGMLGAFLVDYNGTKVGVGSGLNDAQRRIFWNRKDELLGRTIEIDTFGESTDKAGNKSLNCPIFKRVKHDV